MAHLKTNSFRISRRISQPEAKGKKNHTQKQKLQSRFEKRCSRSISTPNFLTFQSNTLNFVLWILYRCTLIRFEKLLSFTWRQKVLRKTALVFVKTPSGRTKSSSFLCISIICFLNLEIQAKINRFPCIISVEVHTFHKILEHFIRLQTKQKHDSVTCYHWVYCQTWKYFCMRTEERLAMNFGAEIGVALFN